MDICGSQISIHQVSQFRNAFLKRHIYFFIYSIQFHLHQGQSSVVLVQNYATEIQLMMCLLLRFFVLNKVYSKSLRVPSYQCHCLKALKDLKE